MQFDVNLFTNLSPDMRTFLLETAEPMIIYLQNSEYNLPEEFSKACMSNATFLSNINASPLNPVDSIQAQVFSLVTVLLQEYSEISEYSDCSCHAADRPCQSKIVMILRNYLNQLKQILFEHKLVNQVVNPDFVADYELIRDNLLTQKITFQAARANLLFWQESISESVLQNHLLQLTYSYIDSLINK
jgi:hypothetical protein